MIKKRVAIFISGQGSNMLALIKASLEESYPAEIAYVLSDKETAKGLLVAQEYGIETDYLDPKSFANKQAYEAEIHKRLQEKSIDIICLAGFMRLLSSYMCDLWAGKMINIHPALLPSFKGLHTHQRAIEAGVKFSGCTVHFVTSEMDAGRIIAQAVVPVYSNDTSDILAARVLETEHEIYPRSLSALCKNVIDSKISFYFSEQGCIL